MKPIKNDTPLPIWSAYILGPALVVLLGFNSLREAESPMLVGIMLALCGLGCAAILHLVQFLRGKD